MGARPVARGGTLSHPTARRRFANSWLAMLRPRVRLGAVREYAPERARLCMRPWATMVMVVMTLMWLALPATTLLAQGETLGASGKKEELPPSPPEDKQSVSSHTVAIAGREIPYRAT